MGKIYDIDIDSYIGSWYASKRFIKNKLNEFGNKEITVRVNSLGGDVDTALDIAAQFEAHGNVVCDLYAFNASSATLLTMGAKKVRIHENSMYLIHKPMHWVDEWGTMNEDDLDAAIIRFSSMKASLEAMTLNLAKIYIRKTGKKINDIFDLMKKNIWIDASTALEWGFVDEIFKGSFPMKGHNEMLNIMNIADLPIPENFISQMPDDDEEETVTRKDFLNEIVSSIKNIFSNSNSNNKEGMSKTFIDAVLIAAILNVENLEATDGKTSLTADQITDIENFIAGKNTEVANLTAQLAAKDNEIANKVQEIANKNTEIQNRDSEIAKLKTDIENAKNAPGDTTCGLNHDGDEVVDKTTSHKFDNSHVEEARKLFSLV